VTGSQLCLLACTPFCAKYQLGRITCKSGRRHRHRIISVLLLPVGHEKREREVKSALNKGSAFGMQLKPIHPQHFFSK